MRKIGKLTKPERDRIARLHIRNYSDRAIGKMLGRSQSTISSEISRNKRWDNAEGKWIYDAIYAQDRSEENRKNSRKRSRMDDPWIYRYVTEKLREGWAPEQIEGILRRDYPTDRTKWIGHSSIYEWIYNRLLAK